MSEAFEARIRAGRGGGAFVEIPDEVHAALGGGGRIKVRARFDGVEYRGSIATMNGVRMLGLLKAIRERLGKEIGDTIRVEVEVDQAPRTVDVPAELATRLATCRGAREFFDSLSYTCRKEYARWIAEAKKPETRERRADRALEMLSAHQKL